MKYAVQIIASTVPSVTRHCVKIGEELRVVLRLQNLPQPYPRRSLHLILHSILHGNRPHTLPFIQPKVRQCTPPMYRAHCPRSLPPITLRIIPRGCRPPHLSLCPPGHRPRNPLT